MCPPGLAFGLYGIFQTTVQILRQLTRFPDPLPDILFPLWTRQVEDWWFQVRNIANIPSIAQWTQMRDTATVQRLSLVKSFAFPHHEYVIASIHDNTGARIARLRLERSSGNFGTKAMEEADRKVKEGIAGDNVADATNDDGRKRIIINSSSDSLEYLRRPRDEVQKISWWAKKDMVLKEVSFASGQYPTLVDLVIAATVAHDHDRLYSLLNHQCYWWADSVLAILEGTLDPSQYTVKTHVAERSMDDVWMDKVRATLSGNAPIQEEAAIVVSEDQEKWSEWKPGWNLVRVYLRSPANVARLVSAFDTEKSSFLQREDTNRRIEAERLAELKQLRATVALLRAERLQLEAGRMESA